jgi:hypothetical protein
MKISRLKNIFLFLGSICIWLVNTLPANGQHFVTQQFDKHLDLEKSGTDSSFLISTNYPTTGIVAKIDVNDRFTGAYIIVRNDTLYLTPDEDIDRSDASAFCNLLTFSPPINEFFFNPGAISGPVTFYFINSQTSEQPTQPAEPKKKKRWLFRTRNDQSGRVESRTP